MQIVKVTACCGLTEQSHTSELLMAALIKGYQLAFIHIHIDISVELPHRSAIVSVSCHSYRRPPNHVV